MLTTRDDAASGHKAPKNKVSFGKAVLNSRLHLRDSMVSISPSIPLSDTRCFTKMTWEWHGWWQGWVRIERSRVLQRGLHEHLVTVQICMEWYSLCPNFEDTLMMIQCSRGITYSLWGLWLRREKKRKLEARTKTPTFVQDAPFHFGNMAFW